MGSCCSKPKVNDEVLEEKIFEQCTISAAEVEELSNVCLKYNGKRCSEKWYTFSMHESVKKNGRYRKNIDFKLMCCKREVSILKQLSHRNIIGFVGVYYNQKDLQQFPILVTDEVTSNLLYHLDKVETLQDSEKFKFSCGVSDGLAYLHHQQLAHLNLYTKSIWLTEDHFIKIADLEYACYFNEVSASPSSSVQTRGNPRDPWKFRGDDCVFKFLPEDCRDDKIWSYDAVDIYSFGCVVINIFTLKQPTIEKESQVKEISIQSIESIVMGCITKEVKSMQEVNETMNACFTKHFESVEPAWKPFEAKIDIHGNFDVSIQNTGRETNQGFLKEHSESEEHAQRFAKAKIEANDKVDEAGQDTDKVADQDTDGNPDTLKSGTETQDVAVKTGVVQPDAAQTDTDQIVAAKTDAAQTDTDQTVAAKTDAAQADTDQIVAVLTDVAQTDTDQTVSAKTDAAQTDTDQTVAAKTDAAQADTDQTVAVLTDAAQTDTDQTVAAKTDAAQTDTDQTVVAKTDAVQAETVQPVAVQKDAVMSQELQPSKASNCELPTEDKEEGSGCTETGALPQSFAVAKVQTVDVGMQTECKEIAVVPVLPHENLQDRVNKLEKENSNLISKLTELEEQSFKFTNAFTTADEGSVMKLRDTYRSLQTNGRPAANRAHKKKFKGIHYPITDHTMLAYEAAKTLALEEFKAVSEKFHSLFQLKPPTDINASQEKRSKAMVQSQELLESFHAKPLNEKVYQILIKKYMALTNQAPDGIPQPIKDYYSELAKFTWDCVARTIPMIMSTEVGKFDGDIHETKDGDDEDDDDSNKGKFVSYIYPVLFTSNGWPREVAMKGKVNVSASDDIV